MGIKLQVIPGGYHFPLFPFPPLLVTYAQLMKRPKQINKTAIPHSTDDDWPNDKEVDLLASRFVWERLNFLSVPLSKFLADPSNSEERNDLPPRRLV